MCLFLSLLFVIIYSKDFTSKWRYCIWDICRHTYHNDLCAKFSPKIFDIFSLIFFVLDTFFDTRLPSVCVFIKFSLTGWRVKVYAKFLFEWNPNYVSCIWLLLQIWYLINILKVTQQMWAVGSSTQNTSRILYGAMQRITSIILMCPVYALFCYHVTISL